MEKTVVECTTKKKPGPKPKYVSAEEKRQAQLEAQRRYRQSAKGRQQKSKDDAKYIQTDKGRATRRRAQAKHSTTEKGKATFRRYWQSDKGKLLLRLYWQSERGKAISRKLAAERRHLIRAQRIKEFFVDEIIQWYENCPQGYHVDHIVPIKNDNVCGLHVPWNFQYLTQSENSSKGNKLCQ